MRRVRVELCAVRTLQPGTVARVLDHSQLHAETDAKIRHFALARIANRSDLALYTALAEPARHEHRMLVAQAIGAVALDAFRVDVMDVDARTRMNARMRERFGQRLV